jgi:hypothetical protein
VLPGRDVADLAEEEIRDVEIAGGVDGDSHTRPLKGRGREGAYDAVGDDLEDILSTRHEEVIEIVEHYTFGKQER